ncbi:MAG: LacI family DNA-binding transcriptional regulator [Terriglobia bacterium]|nr:LacI family DNA-binding transcriptional regulator [Terriglobia bacterium]
MHQIADRAGVSLGTVSHVINGTASVREELRERVLEAVRLLGYQPNQLSRGLRRNRTNMIGMIIPDITNPFFPAVVRGVEDVAFKNNFRLVLCNTDNDPAKEVVYLSDLKSFLPAGILIIPSADSSLTITPSGPPVVCLDRRPRGWKGDFVAADNRQGAHKAAEHLIRMGHRCFGIISGPEYLSNAGERLQGFMEALTEAKIKLPPEYLQEASFDRASGHTATLRLLNLVPRPTVIFAANDLMALGALSAVRELRLNCPKDVSIISFDGLDLTEFTNPPLTSVYQPGYQLGYSAANLLLERISGSKKPAQEIILGTELRIRDSVATVRSTAVSRSR